MTPSSSAFPALELKEDDHHHHHQHFQLLFSTTAPSSYHASSSHPSPAFFYTSTNQSLKGGDHSPRPQEHHEYRNKGDKCIFSHGGYGERQVLSSSSSSSSSLLQPMVDESRYKSGHELSVLNKEKGDEGDKISSTDEKWMSSKMRLMRKMMNSGCTAAKTDRKVEDHHQQQPGNSVDCEINISTSNVAIRVCSDCNTTKTPLWRSGPRGPKSLCNACGIRQRKARRAMAAAAASVTGMEPPQSSPLKVKLPANKEKKSHTGNAGQQKKVCKSRPCPPPTKKKSCFEDISSSLSKNSSGFRRVFPQDVEQAAFLLMALSCDLVYT